MKAIDSAYVLEFPSHEHELCKNANWQPRQDWKVPQLQQTYRAAELHSVSMGRLT